jgi:phosphate ABC transporter phosphate-binding protein
VAAAVLVLAWFLAALCWAVPARADGTYKAVTGSGSTWSENAIRQWARNVYQYGMVVNYNGSSSSVGRSQYAQGTVDFAVSEIPYGVQDGASYEAPPTRAFAYMPIVAGGTSLMYNLVINGQRVTSLRMSGDTVAKIFSGDITMWNDAAVAADNPGLTLPARRIVPVVRADGSGTTAQFTAWMLAKQAATYNGLCAKAGRSPCTQTSNFPVLQGMVAKAQSDGVSGFVKQDQNEGSITYVEYSYAKTAGFPVVKLLNDAGYYTLPTAQNVAVGLLGAQIDTNVADPRTYLTQKLAGVYSNPDPRAYPMSSYSYMILPTAEAGTFTADKGKTLGDFAYYFLCDGQQLADKLGYSPLPINLVQAGLDQVKRIPGVAVQNIQISACRNPTFSTTGENTLAKSAPQPQACDKKGPTQCGTAGAGTAGGPAASTRPAGAAGASVASGSGAQVAASGPGGAAAQVPVAGVVSAPVGADTPQAGAANADGQLLAVGSSAAGSGAVAAPLDVAPEAGWHRQQTLMLVSGLLLLGLTIGPPLILRRFGARP